MAAQLVRPLTTMLYSTSSHCEPTRNSYSVEAARSLTVAPGVDVVLYSVHVVSPYWRYSTTQLLSWLPATHVSVTLLSVALSTTASGAAQAGASHSPTKVMSGTVKLFPREGSACVPVLRRAFGFAGSMASPSRYQ